MKHGQVAGKSVEIWRQLVVFLALGVCPFIYSGWPTKVGKNLAVCRNTAFQDDPLVVSDGFRGAILAWTDHRGGDENVYAQRVDGTGKIVWQPDGIPITNTSQDSKVWDMVSDGAGGAIIIWTHDVGPGGDHLYAQRIDGSGTELWTSGGVLVENVFEVWGAQAATDGSGGAYILMWDGWMEGFFWVNRVDSNGQLPWANRVDPNVIGMNNTGGKITADGTGGAIVAWRAHLSASPSTDSHLYGQKIDASGSEVWPAPVAVCATTSPILSYTLVGDGVGGAFYFFSDERSPTTGQDLYGQRVNSSGAALWTANGEVVSAYSDSESAPHAILDSSGGAIVRWRRYVTIGFETEYIQKIDPLGSMVWTAYGIPINLVLDEPYSHDLASDGAGGCIATFGVRTGGVGDFDLYVQRFDATGAIRWGGNGLKITAPPAYPSYPRIVSDGVRGAIVAWKDYREDATRSADIYAQRVVKNGSMGPTTPCQPDVVGHHPWKTPVAADPLSVGQGVFREAWPLFELGGPIPLDISLVYAPDLREKAIATDGRWPFPPEETIQAFTHSGMIRLVEIEDLIQEPPVTYLNILLGDDLLVFQGNGFGGFNALGSVPYQAQLDGDTYIIMDPITQWTYFFPTRTLGWDWGEALVNRCGEVSEIVDRNGNSVSFSYNADQLPISIEDSFGRVLTLTYVDDPDRENRHLADITDDGGRTVTFAYTVLPAVGAGTQTVLSGFTNVNLETVQFAYFNSENNDANLLYGIVQPLTNAHMDQTWSAWPGVMPVVSEQWDAYGNFTSLDLEREAPDTSVVTVTHPDLTQTVFRCKKGRFPLEIVDESGASIACEYEEADQLNAIVDRADSEITVTYHGASGKLASLTNQAGQTYSFDYTLQLQTVSNPSATASVEFSFYDLTRVDYPDGEFETATYDAQGNLATWTDRNDQTWGFTYDGAGFLLQMSNPEDGQITYTYHADGTLASSTDTDCDITSYTYDAFRRLSRVTHPDTFFRELTYDSMDRVTSLIDELEFTISFDYDDNGNLSTATDPFTQSDSYTYDLMDRLENVTNRNDGVTTYAYDQRGRIASLEHSGLFTYQFHYNTVGHIDQILDPLMRSWTIATNAEGLPESFTSPMGLTTSTTRDRTGRITGRIDHLGHETAWVYDAVGRLTAETNPLGRTTEFGYDSAGRLISAVLPNATSASITRNSLGLPSSIEDLNHNPWTMTYTPMGRLNGVSDPLERDWVVSYNSRGLVHMITFPDATTEERIYDETGRLSLRRFSDASELFFNRDELGRVEETNALNLSRNAAGQIAWTADGIHGFGATYSPNGLLEAVSYTNGSFQVIYGYDERNLLVYVSDDLTHTTIDLSYDEDGRLVFINRTNGVATTRVFDDANRLTEIHHGEHVDLVLTRDASGNVQSSDLNGPLDPAEMLGSQNQAFTYDAASQLESAPYAYDLRGRLIGSPMGPVDHDIAGRVVTLDGATLGYNGLGDLRRLDQSPTLLRFFYNYALESPRVVAEMDETMETFRRFYVWTPSGQLLYSIEVEQGNAVRYYHFDHLGNTLCLTDESGLVTDAYAYEPYGQLLGSSGSSDQPYTFLGQYGVRQMNVAGTFYSTHARLYDASTGRFASRDPDWPRLDHPLLLNPYGYALCRPTTVIDTNGRLPSIPQRQEQLVKRWIQGLMQFPELGVERIVSNTHPDFHGSATLANDPTRTATFASMALPRNPSWRAQTAEKGMFNDGMRTSGGQGNDDHEIMGLIVGSDFSPVNTLHLQLAHLLKKQNSLVFSPRGSQTPPSRPSRLITEHGQAFPATMIPSRHPYFDGRIHQPMEPDDLRPLIHLGKTESVWKLYRKKTNQVQRKYPNTARTGWIHPQAGPKQAAR